VFAHQLENAVRVALNLAALLKKLHRYLKVLAQHPRQVLLQRLLLFALLEDANCLLAGLLHDLISRHLACQGFPAAQGVFMLLKECKEKRGVCGAFCLEPLVILLKFGPLVFAGQLKLDGLQTLDSQKKRCLDRGKVKQLEIL
jgi:hypothetical protein